jgi:hypothetical protein
MKRNKKVANAITGGIVGTLILTGIFPPSVDVSRKAQAARACFGIRRRTAY